MAKKGQKQRKYSEKFIEKVVKERLEEGTTAPNLSKKYNIPEGTIVTWMYKYRKTGQISRLTRGRPKVKEETNYKEKYEILKKFLESLEEVEQEKK
jgi:transposase